MQRLNLSTRLLHGVKFVGQHVDRTISCRHLRTKALIPKVPKPAVPTIKPPIIVKQSPTQLANVEKAKIVEGKLDAGVRINRCFPEFSRTQSDRLIESGRVTVNGEPAKLGTKLCKGDVVMLDGTEVHWSQYVEKTAMPYPKGLNLNNGFVYIKYFKDLGVTTTAGRAPDGVLNTGHFKNVTQTIKSKVGGKDEVSVLPVDRLLPVGRLDNQSTGALLLTSDPRLPAWVLGANTGCSKVYEVLLDRLPTLAHINKWREGMTLTTAASSATGKDHSPHPTLPCWVEILRRGPSDGALNSITSFEAQRANFSEKSTWMQFTLKEGRNRQIRRMVHALGYSVKALHRRSFCGVAVDELKAGEWAYLTQEELQLLQKRK